MVLSVRLALGGAFAALKDASQSKRSRGKIGVLYFIQYTITHIFVSLLALTRCQPRLGGGPDEANLPAHPYLSPILVLQAIALALGLSGARKNTVVSHGAVIIKITIRDRDIRRASGLSL
jgi:hypothetical protein